MSNSNQARKLDMDSEVLTPHTLKLVPKNKVTEPNKDYGITHNFMSDFGVEVERDGFFDDLGEFLA